MGKWLLAILLTHGADPKSQLVLIDPTGSTVAAEIEHLPDGSIHGALLPGTRTAFVVADRTPSIDRSFAGALLRVEPGRAPVQLCDRVFHASTPLVTRDGRVLVERGRAGPELDGKMRVDELTIDEWSATGTRTIWRGRGYTAWLAGLHARELIVYLVDERGAALIAVNLDGGGARTILPQLPPFARDFQVDGNDLIFANRDDHRRDLWVIERVDLASGRRTRLIESHTQALAPHPFGSDVAYNDGGLRLLGGGRVEHAPGIDVMAASSPSLGALLHFSDGWPSLEVTDGKQVRQIAAPADSHIQVVGFVE